MQTLAAYLLEKREITPLECIEHLKQTEGIVNTWLTEKGASEPEANAGTFRSLTSNSSGTYRRESAIDSDRSWREIRLEELTRDEQVFTTTISIVHTKSEFLVYTSLTATSKKSIIAPVSLDARCPSVVRRIIESNNSWTIGNTTIPKGKLEHFNGREAGNELAAIIQSPERALPVIVVSDYDGAPVWKNAAHDLAYDLAGLSRIIAIDEQASWALTDQLGKKNSCYSGAIRLYWPKPRSANPDRSFLSTVWTAAQLLSDDQDGDGEHRFRTAMRRRIMAVSALTVVPPNEIQEIQSFSAIQKIRELEGRAASSSEILALAESYAKDAEAVRVENRKLRDDLSIAITRAENSEAIVASYTPSEKQNNQVIASIDEDSSPASGDIRFYKKLHSKPSYDVLVRVDDCGHTKWQSASKADKAKKGIERLEHRNDWELIQHCGSCTGGGMWRVRW